jgi:hypothetical protein
VNFTDEALQILARQLGENSVASREELEAKMTTLLRVVMQTGHGRPSLVQWVKTHLRVVAPASCFGQQVDADWAAPRMARLLCSQLLQKIRGECARTTTCDTVVA